jgi:L-aspartate oxidase
VLDLLRTADGPGGGHHPARPGEGTEDGVGSVHARPVVLATGGMGQVFSSTTNPSVSTGDGVALALRAGAAVADLEFVQFHPTSLFLGPGASGQQPLVSEALRGEGAFLVDAKGERVITVDDHPLADLAPRDVVAKAITRRMLEQSVDHVFLDARHLGEELLLSRFPTIVARCREAGLDPVTEPVPVAPRRTTPVRACAPTSTAAPTSRPVRLRRGRLHRRARRQPARLQQPARGAGVRRAHRGRPARAPAAGRAGPGRDEACSSTRVRPSSGAR